MKAMADYLSDVEKMEAELIADQEEMKARRERIEKHRRGIRIARLRHVLLTSVSDLRARPAEVDGEVIRYCFERALKTIPADQMKRFNAELMQAMTDFAAGVSGVVTPGAVPVDESQHDPTMYAEQSREVDSQNPVDSIFGGGQQNPSVNDPTSSQGWANFGK